MTCCVHSLGKNGYLFNCWTRKEAILKAVGTGLSFPLDRVVVTLAPNDARASWPSMTILPRPLPGGWKACLPRRVTLAQLLPVENRCKSIAGASDFLRVKIRSRQIMISDERLDCTNEADPRQLAGRLHTHVDRLAGLIGPRHLGKPVALEAAATYIEREFQNFGDTVERQSYDVGRQRASNLVIERRGTKRPEEIVILGAHYDTVSTTPGADDNASAVAVLLEVARLPVQALPGGQCVTSPCLAKSLSGNSSFWDQGYPALMLTDTSFLRNPHYHEATDTPDTLDYDRMAEVTLGVAGAMRRLGRFK